MHSIDIYQPRATLDEVETISRFCADMCYAQLREAGVQQEWADMYMAELRSQSPLQFMPVLNASLQRPDIAYSRGLLWNGDLAGILLGRVHPEEALYDGGKVIDTNYIHDQLITRQCARQLVEEFVEIDERSTWTTLPEGAYSMRELYRVLGFEDTGRQGSMRVAGHDISTRLLRK